MRSSPLRAGHSFGHILLIHAQGHDSHLPACVHVHWNADLVPPYSFTRARCRRALWLPFHKIIRCVFIPFPTATCATPLQPSTSFRQLILSKYIHILCSSRCAISFYTSASLISPALADMELISNKCSASDFLDAWTTHGGRSAEHEHTLWVERFFGTDRHKVLRHSNISDI